MCDVVQGGVHIVRQVDTLHESYSGLAFRRGGRLRTVGTPVPYMFRSVVQLTRLLWFPHMTGLTSAKQCKVRTNVACRNFFATHVHLLSWGGGRCVCRSAAVRRAICVFRAPSCSSAAFVCSAVRTAQHASLRVQRTPLRRNRVTSSALQKEKQMDQSRTSHRHPGSGGRVPHRKR